MGFDCLSSYYEWFRVLHIIAFTSWMAGMFYLPRLFVYHCQVGSGTDEDKRFQTMERRLLRIIINPSMIATILAGLMLASIYGWGNLGVWFHIKVTLVVLMTALHGFLSVCRKNFAQGENKYSERIYRIINEIPVVLFVVIVILVIIKPFD
jgi:putative membrane protein